MRDEDRRQTVVCSHGNIPNQLKTLGHGITRKHTRKRANRNSVLRCQKPLVQVQGPHGCILLLDFRSVCFRVIPWLKYWRVLRTGEPVRAIMRRHEIELGSHGHDAGRIDVPVTQVVMALYVVHINSVRDTGHLVEITHVVP